MKPLAFNPGWFGAKHVTVPLCVRKAKSARIAKGNRTRRLNEMRHCRELMEAAADYPLNLMVPF